MKLKLPDNNSLNLNQDLPMEIKNTEIHWLIENYKIEVLDGDINLEEYLRRSWWKNSTKSMLDILGYYLTKDNYSNKYKHDKEVMSSTKMKEMIKGSKKHTTFSNISQEDKATYGLSEYFDDVDNYE